VNILQDCNVLLSNRNSKRPEIRQLQFPNRRCSGRGQLRFEMEPFGSYMHWPRALTIRSFQASNNIFPGTGFEHLRLEICSFPNLQTRAAVTRFENCSVRIERAFPPGIFVCTWFLLVRQVGSGFGPCSQQRLDLHLLPALCRACVAAASVPQAGLVINRVVVSAPCLPLPRTS
jgi:hypothetical protein